MNDVTKETMNHKEDTKGFHYGISDGKKKDYKFRENMKKYILASTPDYTSDNVDNVEQHLKSQGFRYESYPMKNRGWEIRFVGRNIGTWKGFEYVTQSK